MSYNAKKPGKSRKIKKEYVLIIALLLVSALIFGSMFLKKPQSSEADNTEKLPAKVKPAHTAGYSCLVINVPFISQSEDFPTGCESVSAVMALNFYGLNITVEDFVENYLDKSDSFYTENGVYYGPSPYECFVGNPAEYSGYGCYAPVIEKAVCKFLKSENAVLNTTGKSLEYLCKKYIDNGTPVLLWASMGMYETCPSDSWTLENGGEFTWISGEHCLVLTGYDENYYYFNDPLAEKNTAYEKQTVNLRYEELGAQSLVINEDVLSLSFCYFP